MVWYLVQRRDVRPRTEWTVSLDEHLEWIRRQHEAGSVLISGPTVDHTMGIYVIKAPSREAAEAIARTDPYIEAGYCAFEVLEWEVHQVLGAGPFSAAALQAH